MQMQPAEWLTRARLETAAPTLFFHARDKLAQGLLRGSFRLLGALADHARAAGWQVQVLGYAREAVDLAARHGGHLHVVLEDRPLYAPNVFHAVPGYLRGWWYFDELGTRNNSSARLRRFDPRLVADGFAARFHARLADDFIGRNFSKFQQVDRGSSTIVPGALVLFAQDFQPPRWHRHYLTVPDLITAAIAARGDRPLYIKPHPNNTADERAWIMARHDPGAGVHVTDASIHDLLAGCACALTVTSAVGFEAFLHRKPVVLAGQTDFAQNAITLTDAAALPQAMGAAMAGDWPHEKFVTWFLRQNLHEDHPRALPDLLAKIAAKGIALGPGPGFY